MNFLIEEKDDKTKQYISQQKNLCNEIKSLTDKIKLKIEKIEKNAEAKNTETNEQKENCEKNCRTKTKFKENKDSKRTKLITIIQ